MLHTYFPVLLLLGFALARPAWIPAPEGTSTVVLLDRGAAMRGDGWRAALGEARRSLLGTDGAAAGELVLEAAREAARREAVPPARAGVRIVAAELGSEAGLVGAGLVAFEALDGIR